jgi:hypothetical protein
MASPDFQQIDHDEVRGVKVALIATTQRTNSQRNRAFAVQTSLKVAHG